MIRLEVLVEGISDEPVVREVLVRKFKQVEGVHFRIHPHRGRGALPKHPLRRPDPKRRGLLDQLPAKLMGYARQFVPAGDALFVVVLIDVDSTPCVEMLAQLNIMLQSLPVKPKVLFRLAIEETESWFIADREALQRAYPGRIKMASLRSIAPDSVCGSWEALARALGQNPKLVGPGAKTAWARHIAPHLDLERPASPSFRKFIEGVGRLVENDLP